MIAGQGRVDDGPSTTVDQRRRRQRRARGRAADRRQDRRRSTATPIDNWDELKSRHRAQRRRARSTSPSMRDGEQVDAHRHAAGSRTARASSASVPAPSSATSASLEAVPESFKTMGIDRHRLRRHPRRPALAVGREHSAYSKSFTSAARRRRARSQDLNRPVSLIGIVDTRQRHRRAATSGCSLLLLGADQLHPRRVQPAAAAARSTAATRSS